MQLYGLLKYLFDGRMKACQQRRMFPAIRRDLGKDVGAREAMREKAVEEHVQLRIRQALVLPILHAPRLASSPARDQLWFAASTAGSTGLAAADNCRVLGPHVRHL
jgi:hypothetical protein